MSNRFDQYCFQELGKAFCKNSWQFGEAHPAAFCHHGLITSCRDLISVPGTRSNFCHHGLITSCRDLISVTGGISQIFSSPDALRHCLEWRTLT